MISGIKPGGELARLGPERVLSGGSGLDLGGYRDYRGKEVIGAWEWEPDPGVGLAVEVDARRAYAPYAAARLTIFLLLGIGFGASLVTLSYLWRRSRSQECLVESLQTAEKILTDEIELRNEFISVASHELRTPLTPIRMELDLVGQLARSGTLGSFPGERLNALNDISIRETERIKEIIQNYLDVTRISQGHFPLEFKETDLVRLAKEICDRFSATWLGKPDGIQVIAADRVVGFWDRLRIEQVIIHLLSDAIKYGQGKPIEVRVESLGPSARLTVTDHGIGIAAADRSRIFKRFEKADSSPVLRGLGVGLYIVKRIVEDHGGTISVESAPGQGTRFVVTLPKAAKGARAG